MYTGPEKTEWFGPHHCKFAIRPPALAESELPRSPKVQLHATTCMRNQLGWCVKAIVEERATFLQLEKIIWIEISWKEGSGETHFAARSLSFSFQLYTWWGQHTWPHGSLSIPVRILGPKVWLSPACWARWKFFLWYQWDLTWENPALCRFFYFYFFGETYLGLLLALHVMFIHLVNFFFFFG